MSITNQQRENIIVENNTAQSRLLDILENYSRQSTNLTIQEQLHGEIDLSPLRDLGFGLIDTIILGKGEITNLINIPKGITSFTCTDNLLKMVENLPSSLSSINLSGNMIEDIDVSNLKNLQSLNLSHNKLTQLENLPLNLEELLCDFNQLHQLNLEGLTKLKTLNISNNKITLIENIDTITNLIYDNNPSINFRNSNVEHIGGDETNDNEDNTNYKDALNLYFRMKNEYETKIHDKKKRIYDKEPNKKIAKRLIQQYTPECIKCKRKVGTIFTKDENIYKAICGDTQNPCNLNVELFAGFLLNFKDGFDMTKEDFEKTREIIDMEKLNDLFDYVSSEDNINLYKKTLELYTESENSYKSYLETHNNLYNNTDTINSLNKAQDNLFSYIEKSKQLIDEYKKTNNREFLKTAMDLRVNEIKRELSTIRRLKYGIMEMVTHSTQKAFPVNTLYQNEVSLDKLDYSSLEQQRVISFTI